MKVAIDCRPLTASPSGIPNYVVQAINTFAVQNPTWQLYLLSNKPFHPELAGQLVNRVNIISVIEPLNSFGNKGMIWYAIKIQSIVKRIQPDVFWASAFVLPPSLPVNVKTIITVPDVVFKKYKHTMSFLNRLFFELLHDSSIKKADMLWAISHYTRQEIEHFFPERKCRDIFIGLSINEKVFKQIPVLAEEKTHLLKKYQVGGKLLLFVGTLEPRKNLPFLLFLMPALAKQGYSLLVVGAKGWGKTHIREVIEAADFPKDHVSFAGFVPTDELVKLYNIASVYISASSNEGFGLPQLEAMACGCPVVSPHNSAMIEVVEGVGETVKSWDKEEWIHTINKVYANRESYIQAGLRKVQENDWDNIIRRLTIYINEHLVTKH